VRFEEKNTVSDENRVERLVRKGIIRRGQLSSNRPALQGPPPKREPGSPSALEMLLDERGSAQ
jgi:hypothetical protein